MWRSKKFILIALLIAVVLVGSTAGVVLARSANEGERTGAIALDGTTDVGGASSQTLLARVVTILNQQGVTIDQATLQSAFTQAQQEIRNEALDNYLNNLVTQGKITQEQANQYKTWWQSKPDLPIGFGLRSHGGFRGWAGPCITPND